MRLTESKLFDDLSVIMTIQERRTQKDRETDKRSRRLLVWVGDEGKKVVGWSSDSKADTTTSLKWATCDTLEKTGTDSYRYDESNQS